MKELQSMPERRGRKESWEGRGDIEIAMWIVAIVRIRVYGDSGYT